MPKYVVFSTLKEAKWNNSTIIRENIIKEIKNLKQAFQEIHIEGSATLVRTLAESDLIDEYRFLIHPIIIGSGKRFYQEGMNTKGMKVTTTRTLEKGVVLLCYQHGPKKY